MRVALAIDIGATNLRAGLVSEDGRILELRRSLTPERGVVDAAGDLAEDLVRRADVVGVASVGPMDVRRGVLLSPPNLRESGEIDVVGRLTRRFGLEVVLLNDAVAGAIGEWKHGAGMGSENLVYLTFSTGLGAGVIVDGRPLMGARGNAHEVGHIVVDYSGRLRCGCGGVGHWEAYCSGTGVPRLAALLAAELPNARSRLREILGSGGLPDAPTIFRLAREGDELALEVVHEFSRVAAAGIASVASAYDPEVIVLGGPVYLHNRDLLDSAIEEYLPNYSMGTRPKLVPAALGEASPLVGAATAALEGSRGPQWK
ncbi:MAG: ROK family protein [Conexivisphaera sp.]